MVPSPNSVHKSPNKSMRQSGSKVSICLVRHHDGIIYNTGFNFNYNSLQNQLSQQVANLSANNNNINNNNNNNNNNIANYVNLINKIHQQQLQQQLQRDKDNSLLLNTPKPSLKRHSINL